MQYMCVCVCFKVTLQIDRIYGSLDSIQVEYKVYSQMASGEPDYRELQYGSIIMTSGQISGKIIVPVSVTFFRLDWCGLSVSRHAVLGLLF